MKVALPPRLLPGTNRTDAPRFATQPPHRRLTLRRRPRRMIPRPGSDAIPEGRLIEQLSVAPSRPAASGQHTGLSLAR
ncbi:MAG TPA: hypothetical protein VND19_03040 [Acetobacteraceae bacterium]|nr:hypothetical protein [Acetobacteraceae bacterium]